MRKYLRCSLIAFQKHMVYRARVINWIIVDTTHILIFPFLWISIYAGRSDIGGFSQADIVTYYIVSIFIGMCTNAHNSRYIQEDIIKGRLNTLLIKPIWYPPYRYMVENGYRVMMAPLFFLILFFSSFFISDLIRFPTSLETFLLFLMFVLCAHIIFAFIELIIGFSAFFLQEIQGISFLRSMLEKLLGGAFAPISLLPISMQLIAAWMPFQYLYFIPTQIYLGKITGAAVLVHLTKALGWILLLGLCITLMWKRGLRRYDGGGM